jgi:hypothetical protein
MSQFEFIFVLVSIVLGLALTRLLDGLSHVLQNKSRHQGIDLVHLGFSLAVVVLIVIIWWALFRWQHETAWNFPKYLVIVIHMASFYALAAVLYPGRDPDVPDFEEIRTGFYVVLAANSLLEILHTYMLQALFTPWYYLPLTGHLAALCFVGMIARRRRVDLLIGWWFVAVLTVWPFLARYAI